MDDFLISDPDCSDLIARAAGVTFNPTCDQSIARMLHGEVACGVLYQNWTRESIMGHTAVFCDNAVNRDFLWMAYDYPFNQLKVKRIFGFVPETNMAALGVNSHMGFQEVARIDGMFPHGVAAIVMKIERAEAERFLKLVPRHFIKRLEN